VPEFGHQGFEPAVSPANFGEQFCENTVDKFYNNFCVA
jgi:hypothetical protein